jgi:hypothetical protein
LLAGETAPASIWVWNNGDWEDSGNNVEVQDYFLGASDTLDAGTKIEVAWHRNVWTWRRPGESSPIRTGVLYVEDLLAGSHATVEEIDFNALNRRVYTGNRHEVWDLKMNTGESITAPAIIDYCLNVAGDRYKWLTVLCDAPDNLDNIEPYTSPGVTETLGNALAGPYEPFFFQPEIV